MTDPENIPILRRDVTPEQARAHGAYIEGEAEGAYPNGTRILKVAREDSDGTALGTRGVVLASHYVGHIRVDGERQATYFYFVLFDDFPAPIGIADWKIGKEDVL